VTGRILGVLNVTGYTNEKINAYGVLVGKNVGRRKPSLHGRIILK
jgi:hypothetical protein